MTRVLVKKPGQAPEMKEIKFTREELSKKLGTLDIEMLDIGVDGRLALIPGIAAFADRLAKFRSRSLNFEIGCRYYREEVYGTVIFAGRALNGRIVSLKDYQAEKIVRYFEDKAVKV